MKKILLFLCAIIVFYGYNSYQSFQTQILNETKTVITIKKSETFYSLSEKFDIDPRMLQIYLNLNPPEFALGTGQYEIPQEATLEDIITALEFPLTDEMNLTFLEGWNIFDYDLYLSRQGLIDTGAFIAYAENPEKIQALREFFPEFLGDYESLEGFLYPDTYTVDVSNFGINKLVIKMLENYEAKIGPLIAGSSKNDIYELTILASIVEKEERNPAEKSTVAGILKKRLDERWFIGADITVCYAFRLTSDECRLSVTKYLYEKNDYNTRNKIGLPKTPIANPSLETIQATLNPKDTAYYYYLHDTQTGQIYYGRTNDEHVSNKRLYLR